MPDIKEAKCFKFIDQFLPPAPLGSLMGGGIFTPPLESFINTPLSLTLHIQTFASPRLVKINIKK